MPCLRATRPRAMNTGSWASPCSAQLRFLPKLLKPLGRRLGAGRLPCKSEDLIVDDVIAVAAPRVKHHRVVSHIARQKLRRHGEAF